MPQAVQYVLLGEQRTAKETEEEELVSKEK